MTELDRRSTDTPTEVKRAVKEALDDKRIEDIGAQLTALSTQMTAGFTAVATRQDIANGRTSKNEKEIEIMKVKSSNSVLYTNILWFLITTLVGVTVYLITN